MSGFDFFAACEVPRHWRYLGYSNTLEEVEDGEKRVTCYGLVFEDVARGIRVRLCYLTASERYVIVEKDGRGKYSVVCDYPKRELWRVNDFMAKRYVL